MKRMAYPLEAVSSTDWTRRELQAVRWLAQQQAGAVALRTAPENRNDVVAATGRICLALPLVRWPGYAVGLFLLDSGATVQADTEAALDYFAGQVQPGGLLAWRLRPGVAAYLERALVPFFDVVAIDGTRLAWLDLARLDPYQI